MPKHGIKIISDIPGDGPELQKGQRVRLKLDIQFNRGEFWVQNQQMEITIGDRNYVAGFRYGLEGMRAGGLRKFKASPHLCYRDCELPNVPKNAVLIFTVKDVEVLSQPD